MSTVYSRWFTHIENSLPAYCSYNVTPKSHPRYKDSISNCIVWDCVSLCPFSNLKNSYFWKLHV